MKRGNVYEKESTRELPIDNTISSRKFQHVGYYIHPLSYY